jgi:hypothetical protein
MLAKLTFLRVRRERKGLGQSRLERELQVREGKRADLKAGIGSDVPVAKRKGERQC